MSPQPKQSINLGEVNQIITPYPWLWRTLSCFWLSKRPPQNLELRLPSCSRAARHRAAEQTTFQFQFLEAFIQGKNCVFPQSKVLPGSQKGKWMFPLSQPSSSDNCTTSHSSIWLPVPNTSPSYGQNSQNSQSSYRCYQKLLQGHSAAASKLGDSPALEGHRGPMYRKEWRIPGHFSVELWWWHIKDQKIEGD